MDAELTGLPAFIAIAETRNFRLSAERLGVSRPAISQALRALEDRIGVALVHRTTRSVSLTEAGQSLYDRIAPALGEVGAALENIRDRPSQPTGQLRLTVSSIAECVLSGSFVAGFVEACPGIKLDLTVSDDEEDFVARGFDAGVRLGETLAQDVIAVPISGRQRQMVVASPNYIERHGRPVHPRDLDAHICIGWRPSPEAAPYRWEFTEDGRDYDVSVEPRVTTNDMWTMLRSALAGAGLTFGLEETFKRDIEEGRLVSMLEDFCPPFDGFFLFYPSRRHLAPKMRSLIDYAQARRRTNGG